MERLDQISRVEHHLFDVLVGTGVFVDGLGGGR
jgi:hypothetical protein